MDHPTRKMPLELSLRRTRRHAFAASRVGSFLAACLFAASGVRANVGFAPHAMVACADPAAADAGVNVLKAGGNAVDAAVAAAFTLGVVNGHHSGIGGGCFMVLRTPDGKFYALDGREQAPAKATPGMFIRDGKGNTKLSQDGPLASGAPGSVAVYSYAVDHFGKKKLADLLRPAADLAEHGFRIDRAEAARIKMWAKVMAKYPGMAAVFLHPDGTPLDEGEIIHQPDLAKSYRAIADQGSDWFYKGPFAKAVGDWMSHNGGVLSADDLAGYQMRLRDPLVTSYRGYQIVGFPPPSSGGVHVAQILNILQNFDIGALQKQDPALRVHVIAEAMKLAFADRAFWLGDPDQTHVPRGLADAGYGKQLADKIKLDATLTNIDHGTPPDAATDYFGKHTTHIAAADDQGNWVSITATVNTWFGSKVIVPGTGVILNDQMDDFAIQPGVPNAFGLVGSAANAPGPGKRPLSSMSPTLVLKDGKPFMTIGAAGGPTIITQVLLGISNVIDLGDDLPTALARPRFHHQWQPDKLNIEKTFPTPVLDELTKLGHPLKLGDPVGACNAVMQLPDGSFIGVSEPRGSGEAGGPPKPEETRPRGD
jgi:gamma-glutamyltranspeptidase/glutathione hydrolase